MHGTDIGEETCTHILYIKNHHIYAFQLLGGWFLVFPVNRNDRGAGFNIPAVGHLFPGIFSPPETMFGGKCFDYPDVSP